MYKRIFIPPKHPYSFFLFGPRQTGKTTFIENYLKDAIHLKYDFLESEISVKFQTHPEQFRLEVENFIKEHASSKVIIFVDEVQKVPIILDGVHWLLNKYKNVQFILTGSSARKLRRGDTNMLGGRSLECSFHPLTFLEFGDSFNLNIALARGTMPHIVDADSAMLEQLLNSYCSNYLKQEIINESLIRNISPFNRFLNIAADKCGELINYSDIAKAIGVASKTITEYYQILEDTLIGYKVLPYTKVEIDKISKRPKFYLFDLGVTNFLCHRRLDQAFPKTSLYGKQFEQFIFLEFKRLSQYYNDNLNFYYWRKSEKLEIDLIIEGKQDLIACEIKSGELYNLDDFAGITEFSRKKKNVKKICLCNTKYKYQIDDIEVWPWQEYFRKGIKHNQ